MSAIANGRTLSGNGKHQDSSIAITELHADYLLRASLPDGTEDDEPLCDIEG